MTIEMLRDDFPMLRKMFNEPDVPINVDIWLEEGNLLDLGNFRLNVMYTRDTPRPASACSIMKRAYCSPPTR